MVRSTDVVLDDGDVAVLKVATGGDVDALRREARRLEIARHPGVVEVLGSCGDDDRWELCLAHGGRPASLLHLAAPELVASVAAAAAAVLADLHGRGVVHGHLCARHVLLGREGEVRLCGFGPDAGDATPGDDVAALGEVIVELLGSREVLEPIPGARWRRRGPWDGIMRRALLTLADLACAEPASRRPTAGQLAVAIKEAVPGEARARGRRPELQLRGSGGTVRAGTHLAASEHAPARRPHPPRHLREHVPRVQRWAPAVAAAAGGALLLAGIGGWAAGGPTASDEVEGPCAVLEPSEACQPVLIDGTTVSVGSVRFAVGAPGDQVAVGDWDCDGRITAAVLRPPTGEVFLFDGWAADEVLEVAATAVIPGGRSLQPSQDTCGPPLVVGVDGALTPAVGGGIT